MKEYSLGNSKEEVLRLLPDRVIKKIQLDEIQLAGLRIGEEIHIFQSFCPHRGASLLQANINGAMEIICPLHQYRFNLKTGTVRSGYCEDLKVYPNQLEENGLKIIVP